MMLSWNVKCPVGILKVLPKEGDVLCFDDIVVKINEECLPQKGKT